MNIGPQQIESMKIYTKSGDRGQTQLPDGHTLAKSHTRIELIGTLDELNSAIGVAVSFNPSIDGCDELFIKVQNELFEWGAVAAGASPSLHSPPGEEAIQRLENEIDHWQDSLTAMTHFILPGGSSCGAAVHFARTVCRRAERLCTLLIEQSADDTLNPLQVYLNRLSDWLFVAARSENQAAGVSETKWQPR